VARLIIADADANVVQAAVLIALAATAAWLATATRFALAAPTTAGFATANAAAATVAAAFLRNERRDVF
jgi:hypothetical protein